MKNRRVFLKRMASLGMTPSLISFLSSCKPRAHSRDELQFWTKSGYRKHDRSEVFIVKASGYTDQLAGMIREAIQQCGLQVRGKRVLLKPNLVEHDPRGLINTHPHIITATVEAMRFLDAKEVAVGEGCGHQRDTEYVLGASGLLDELLRYRIPFIDLNLDDVAARPLRSFYMGIRTLYLPKTLEQFDLIVSMPKMKTHHWAGVTLSMKNLFGVVPGRIYGWPKNFLHQHDIGRSILDINSTVQVSFSLVDGIIAMEGNGPIQGNSKSMNVIVMGRDPVAVDATCCRLMGVDPYRVEYMRMANAFLGNLDSASITQSGEPIEGAAKSFELPPSFEYLRARA